MNYTFAFIHDKKSIKYMKINVWNTVYDEISRATVIRHVPSQTKIPISCYPAENQILVGISPEKGGHKSFVLKLQDLQQETDDFKILFLRCFGL